MQPYPGSQPQYMSWIKYWVLLQLISLPTSISLSYKRFFYISFLFLYVQVLFIVNIFLFASTCLALRKQKKSAKDVLWNLSSYQLQMWWFIAFKHVHELTGMG